jgi:hypothetical protein
MYKAGYHYQAIAKQLGRTYAAVMQHVRNIAQRTTQIEEARPAAAVESQKSPLPRANQNRTKTEEEQLIQLRNSCFTPRAISSILGRTVVFI